MNPWREFDVEEYKLLKAEPSKNFTNAEITLKKKTRLPGSVRNIK